MSAVPWDRSDDLPAEQLLVTAGWSAEQVGRCRAAYEALRESVRVRDDCSVAVEHVLADDLPNDALHASVRRLPRAPRGVGVRHRGLARRVPTVRLARRMVVAAHLGGAAAHGRRAAR